LLYKSDSLDWVVLLSYRPRVTSTSSNWLRVAMRLACTHWIGSPAFLCLTWDSSSCVLLYFRMVRWCVHSRGGGGGVPLSTSPKNMGLWLQAKI
jgi:hypothetical protein